MKRIARRLALVGLAVGLGGCVVAAPLDEPVYGPPAVVVERPDYRWSWGFFPHWEVEHHYVVDNDRVIVHDRHYSPFGRSADRYVHNDHGQHRGWYKHDD